jgi:hypothetical protein
MPDDDPKAHSVDLAPLFGAPLPAGIPRWLEVRKVERKIDQRIEALLAGESPESLKLGRELSGAACVRLLRQLEDSLQPQQTSASTEIGEIELAFGPEHAFNVLTGKPSIQTAAWTRAAPRCPTSGLRCSASTGCRRCRPVSRS